MPSFFDEWTSSSRFALSHHLHLRTRKRILLVSSRACTYLLYHAQRYLRPQRGGRVAFRMTDRMPPNLLALFAPRPPLRWMEPLDYAAQDRKTYDVSSVAQYLPALQHYKETDK